MCEFNGSNGGMGSRLIRYMKSYVRSLNGKDREASWWHGLWVSHPHPAFFGHHIDYRLGSLDSKLVCSIPLFLVVPIHRGSLQKWYYQALCWPPSLLFWWQGACAFVIEWVGKKMAPGRGRMPSWCFMLMVSLFLFSFLVLFFSICSGLVLDSESRWCDACSLVVEEKIY